MLLQNGCCFLQRVLIACACIALMAPLPARADDAAAPMPLAASAEPAPHTPAFKGAFIEPAFVPPAERTFAAPAVARASTAPAAVEPFLNTTMQIALGAAATITLVMFVLILRACVSTNASGKRRFMWSVEARIATAIGAVVLAVCASGVLCAHASVQAQAAARNANIAVNQGRSLAAVVGKLDALRSRVDAFIATGHDVELDEYAATRRDVVDALDGADAGELQSVTTALRVYHGEVKKVVARLDADRAVISSQITPAHERAEEILGHVRLSLDDSGPGSAGAHLDVAMTFVASIRAALARGLHEPADADAICFASRRASESIAAATSTLNDAPRASALAESAQALAFVERTVRSLAVGGATLQPLMHDLTVAADVLSSKGVTINEYLGHWANAAMKDSDNLAARERLLALGAAGACVLAAMLIGYVIMRGMARRMRRVLACLQGLASNDLMQPPVNSSALDEIGELSRAADKVAAGLRDVITEVSISLTDVSAAAHEVAAGSSSAPAGTHADSALAASQLSQRTEHLLAMVGRYKLDTRGLTQHAEAIKAPPSGDAQAAA